MTEEFSNHQLTLSKMLKIMIFRKHIRLHSRVQEF